jgi:predicted CXXCH cytochrome family protein
MKNRNFPSARKIHAGWRRWPVLAVGTLVLLAAAISCRSVNRSVVVPPRCRGQHIGSKECEQCHDQIYRDFATADHARLIAPGPNAMSAGCESCHGPSSLHSESGGEVKPPNSFTAGRPHSSSFGARVSTENARTVETVCLQCHTDVRGQFNLPSHHPVPEGRLTCTECHSPHKGSIYKGGGTQLMSEKDSCVRCHAAQQGPFVFQHEAMREGCTICHNAHGSVNSKLLAVRDSNLCLKCHFQQVTGGQLLIGGSDHSLRVQQGTCWTAGCHEAIHGSRVSSSLRY